MTNSAVDYPPKPIVKNRNLLIDAGKGLGILLVVLGHALQRNVADYESNLLFRIIYSFHMPLFFFLSGCVAKYGNFQSIQKNIPRLLIPFVMWYVIYIVAFAIIGKHFPDLKDHILMLKNPYYVLWFLFVLFLCHVSFYVIAQAQKLMGIGGGIIAFLIIELLPISALRTLQFQLIFFILGYLIFQNRTIFKKIWPYALLLAIAVYMLLFPYWEMLKSDKLELLVSAYSGFLSMHMEYTSRVYNVVVGLSGIGIVLSILYFVIKLPQPKSILTWLGIYSFDIYVTHQLLYMHGLFSNTVINVLCWFVLALSGALLVSSGLKKIPFFKRVLYGGV